MIAALIRYLEKRRSESELACDEIRKKTDINLYIDISKLSLSDQYYFNLGKEIAFTFALQEISRLFGNVPIERILEIALGDKE